mmetsp:Transcript_4205/g.11847  ORF Transcript_4205/g.11847 Transcript_4205/m.11847 type:complete len:215 (-) Transcript_4205:1528-2172(-)
MPVYSPCSWLGCGGIEPGKAGTKFRAVGLRVLPAVRRPLTDASSELRMCTTASDRPVRSRSFAAMRALTGSESMGGWIALMKGTWGLHCPEIGIVVSWHPSGKAARAVGVAPRSKAPCLEELRAPEAVPEPLHFLPSELKPGRKLRYEPFASCFFRCLANDPSFSALISRSAVADDDVSDDEQLILEERLLLRPRSAALSTLDSAPTAMEVKLL